MRKDLEHAPMADRFQHLESLLSSTRFLNREGLGNEVPFFICPFDPRESCEMEKVAGQLATKLQQKGISALTVNLYDLVLGILESEGDLDWIRENETSLSKEKLFEELSGILDVASVIVPAIADRMRQHGEFHILFLTGIGEVYPYIRSHNVLNNLQRIAKDQPTLMFFPGRYSHSLEKGAALDLFSRLQDDRYYRAFNVYDREV
jgi:hypothetical protein